VGISDDGGGTTARGARRAARRRARWDGDPAPRDWRFLVGSLGKVLMAVGLLMFGFVAYQLWGTGVEYAQAQDDLDQQFEELLAAAPGPAASAPATSAVASTSTVATTAPATTAPATSTVATTDVTTSTTIEPPTTTAAAPVTVPVPALNAGDALARIEIPSIGVDAKVVAGVSASDLKKGPGHYPGTPMPGQLGNSAVAGHRTTYGEPFRRLDDLRPADEIVLTTVQGRFVYRVTGSEVVAPSQSEVVQTTDPSRATLTLTTCDPEFTATNRLIVYADLDTAASGQGLPPVLTYGGAPTAAPTPATLPGEPATATATATTAPDTTAPPATAAPATTGVTAATVVESSAPVTTVGAPATLVQAQAPGGPGEPPAQATTADAFAQGWFSDDGAFAQVALWGLLLTAVSAGAYLLSRTTRRNWVGALAGIVPFLVVLYFFFQNVNRLLPAAI